MARQALGGIQQTGLGGWVSRGGLMMQACWFRGNLVLFIMAQSHLGQQPPVPPHADRPRLILPSPCGAQRASRVAARGADLPCAFVPSSLGVACGLRLGFLAPLPAGDPIPMPLLFELPVSASSSFTILINRPATCVCGRSAFLTRILACLGFRDVPYRYGSEGMDPSGMDTRPGELRQSQETKPIPEVGME